MVYSKATLDSKLEGLDQVRHYLLTVIISKIYFRIYVIYLWGVPSKNLRVKGARGLVPAPPPPSSGGGGE